MIALSVMLLTPTEVGAGGESVVEQTLARLKNEEGFRSKPYTDSRGVMTIGYGTNIGEGITRREGEYLLRERLAAMHEGLTKELPWLSDAPQGPAIGNPGYGLSAWSAWGA